MASVSLYNSIFTEKVGPPQRHSSSAFIAHLLLQEYPPKVQPRSSSTRDHSLYDTLDKVDAEASCILIALANHDKKKDMNDLIPYSIRVIDYNQLPEEPPISAESSVSGSSSCTDGNNDHNNNNCNNSNNSNNSNNKNMNDEISHQDIPKSLDDVNNNRSMSIKNLLGMNSSNDIPASSTSETPSMYGDTNKPLKIQLTSNKSNIPPPSKQQRDEEQANDQPKETSWKRKPKSDPILLLAEAAKAIDRDEQLQNQLTQKRKYSGDDNLNHRSIRPRHPMRDDQILQNEKSKFSYQYLSMKQNPKIKRNAMHAYITYMIYTDLASSDKSYYSQPDKSSTHHQPNGSIFLPPSSSSQLSTPTSQHEFNSSPPFPPPSHHQHHYQHQQNNNTLEHSVEPYSRGKGYSSSTTTTPTVAAAIAAAAPTPPDNWHYGLSNSTPSPSLQHRRDIKLDANGNSNNNSSIMMARPLTAFLRDDLYT